MSHKYTPRSFLCIPLLLLLGACSPQAPDSAMAPVTSEAANQNAAQQAIATPAPAPVICSSCGIVRSITAVSQQGTGTGVGAVLGALAGGVAGNQIGGGSGKKIATVAGVIGGAVVGNKVEQNRNAVSYYEVVIDMESGGQQVFTLADAAGISSGSAVRVQGSNISLR